MCVCECGCVYLFTALLFSSLFSASKPLFCFSFSLGRMYAITTSLRFCSIMKHENIVKLHIPMGNSRFSEQCWQKRKAKQKPSTNLTLNTINQLMNIIEDTFYTLVFNFSTLFGFLFSFGKRISKPTMGRMFGYGAIAIV